jgi:hypothetical protein
MDYNTNHIVEGIVALSETKDIEKQIDVACENCLSNSLNNEKKANNIDIFRTILSDTSSETPKMQENTEIKEQNLVLGDDSDGYYSYEGLVTEVKANVKNKEEFKKKATSYAREQILIASEKSLDLVPQTMDVNSDSGTFTIVFYDSAKKEYFFTNERELIYK